MRARGTNQAFSNVPVDLLFASTAVRTPDGRLNGARMMALITNSTVAEVRWIWRRLKELTHDLAIPREHAVAMVSEELKETPWKN